MSEQIGYCSIKKIQISMGGDEVKEIISNNYQLITENNFCLKEYNIEKNVLYIIMKFFYYNLVDKKNRVKLISKDKVKKVVIQLIIQPTITFIRLDKCSKLLMDSELLNIIKKIHFIGIRNYNKLFINFFDSQNNESHISKDIQSIKILIAIGDEELNDSSMETLKVYESFSVEIFFIHSLFIIESLIKPFYFRILNFFWKINFIVEDDKEKKNCDNCQNNEHSNNQTISVSQSEICENEGSKQIQQNSNHDNILNDNKNKGIIYKKRIYGFKNNMNDCFMNASLQLLTHEESLIENILNINESKINKNTPGNGKLIPEFKKLIGEINNNEDPIDPSNIKSIMGKIDPKYNTDEQQDANEFINTLLMEIHDEINENNNLNPIDFQCEEKEKEKDEKEKEKDEKEKEKEEKEKEKDEKEKEKELYSKFRNKFYKKNNSFIIDLFHGIFKDEIKCQKDHILNIKFRIYNMIELPIIEFIKNETIKLNDILKQFLEKKDSNKTKFCSVCKKQNYFSRQTYIYSLPPLLLLFLNRVVDDKYYYNNIEYDEELSINEKNSYELIGLIEHIGNEKSGHYMAICKGDSGWYKYNDEKHDNIKNIQSKHTIIVLYKRK